ncbi:MAG TPA: ABC transporter substrate-binding protein [Kofleriaceae bacterium]
MSSDDRERAVGGSVADSSVGTSDTLSAPATPIPAPVSGEAKALVAVDPAHYAERREITHGGMGRIVSARDVRLNRTVALKELRVQSPELRARFEREALLTARLQHPSIVSIHEAGRWPSGEPFYAMKLVPGRPLDQVIGDASTLAKRLALLPHVVAVADALAYAHQQRVIHRDLKPQNVLVGEFGETVVIDWGLAKDLSDTSKEIATLPGGGSGRSSDTALGDVLGTPTYMPPEQAEGRHVDERADVYAIGAMLYHVACGHPPYSGTSTDAVLDEVKQYEPEPLGTREPSLPADLVAIVTRAMARDAKARYRTARELADDLHRFQAGQLVGARRYRMRDLIRRWLRRHRVAVTVAALAALVLMLVAIVSVRRIVRDERRVEAAFERAARAQLATAHDLVGRDLGRLESQAEQIALSDELLQAIDSKEHLTDYLAREAAGLPSGLVQVFDAHREPIAELGIGQPSRFEHVRANRGSRIVAQATQTRYVGFEIVGGILVARAIAPIADANLTLRGFVVFTLPFDAAYAKALEAQLHTAVVFRADGGKDVASLDGDADLAPPAGGLPRGGALTKRRLFGRAYLLAFDEIIDERKQVLGTLGVALPQGEQVTAVDHHTLVVGVLTDASTLDPAAAIDTWSTQLVVPLYDTLVRYQTGTSDLEPGLARAWDVSADGLEWTFWLRPGVRFHDGTPVDADAVAFSFERQREDHPYYRPEFTYWKRSLSAIRSIERVAPDTVRFHLDRPFSPFLAYLTGVQASIVSPTAVKLWGAEYGKHPVGTGPYAFVGWSERLTMRRNRDYWSRAARTEHLVFTKIEDPQQRVVALQSGSIDIALELLPRERQLLELEPKIAMLTTYRNSIAFVAINNRRVSDRGVRRAIAFAINKRALVEHVFQGMAVPALGPVPMQVWGYHDPAIRYELDPEQAKRLLADAVQRGAWDPHTVLRLCVSSTPRPYMPRPADAARTIQANLASVGIKTELVMQPFDANRKEMYAGTFDLAVMGWITENSDPDTFLQLLDSDNIRSERPLNVARFDNAAVHDLLAKARIAVQAADRSPLYAKAQDLIAEEAPWVPLAETGFHVGIRDNIEDVAFRIYVVDFARVEKH